MSPGAQKQPFLAGPLPLRPSRCFTGISDSPLGDPQSLRPRAVCPPQRRRCHATTPVTLRGSEQSGEGAERGCVCIGGSAAQSEGVSPRALCPASRRSSATSPTTKTCCLRPSWNLFITMPTQSKPSKLSSLRVSLGERCGRKEGGTY